MKISFLEPARADLEDAVRYYDDQRVGLGAEFSSAVQITLRRITDCPTTWARISANIRRCPTRRFPYDVL
ncbi:MAG: type II toxin-antitoxin system RelE/ParE family toxin [Planctomycetota bacterium]|nr:type II toxin-antitoxin system RelE/ParE family toxin [Planctomycetota bacterium]